MSSENVSDERLAKIVATEAMVYYGWPQRLVAEEATKIARELQSLRSKPGHRVCGHGSPV